MPRRKISEIKKDIQKTIESDILPMLRMDGGGLDFVEYKNGVVKVRLVGACSDCPMSEITLKGMVEGVLVDAVPEVKSVVNLDDDFDDEQVEEKSTKSPTKPLKTKATTKKSLSSKSSNASKKLKSIK